MDLVVKGSGEVVFSTACEGTGFALIRPVPTNTEVFPCGL